tara:strand:- start:3074 stop:3268 length:195 start_codon:yes stop_codon:yes gene_type:complete
MEGYNKGTKEYNTFAMQFGWGMSSISREALNKQYEKKKVYKYIDKRTKKYGAQREHSGKMGSYK